MLQKQSKISFYCIICSILNNNSHFFHIEQTTYVEPESKTNTAAEEKPQQSKESTDCTCNAEKSVRFNLPVKTQRTTTIRNETKKMSENSFRASGHYLRKGTGNTCRVNGQEHSKNTCNTGELQTT